MTEHSTDVAVDFAKAGRHPRSPGMRRVLSGGLAALAIGTAGLHAPSAIAADSSSAQAAARAMFRQNMEQAWLAHKQHNDSAALQYLHKAWFGTANIDDRILIGNWAASIQEERRDYAGAAATQSGILPLKLCAALSGEEDRAYAEAARLAWLAGRREQAYALLAQSHGTPPTRTWGWGKPDMDHWHLEGPAASLAYDLGGMTFPGVTHHFLRESYTSADDSRDTASVTYIPLHADGPLADGRVSINISARGVRSETVAQDMHYWLTGVAGSFSGHRHVEPGVKRTKVPAVLPAGKENASGVQVATGTVSVADDKGAVHEYGAWVSRRGIWQIRVIADWPARNHDAAQQAIAGLIGAIRWQPDQASYQGVDNATLEQDKQFDLAMQQKQWQKASALAEKRIGSARFPRHLARLYSAIAIAAFHRQRYTDAMAAMRKAMHYWHYSSLGHSDEDFYDTLLLYAADTAFHLGKNGQAITWMNARTEDLLDAKWTLDKATGALRYNPMDIALPARLGDFLRIWHGGNKVRYERIQPPQDLGITMLDKIPVSGNGKIPSSGNGTAAPNDTEAIETSLRTWMTNGLRVSVGAMHRVAYPPASRGQARGAQLLFDFSRHDDDGTPRARVMSFWVSRLQGRAVVLRSGWAQGDSAGEQAAAEAAEAFAWPAALHPVAIKPQLPELECKASAMAQARPPGMSP